jgi:RNA-binding protein 26
MSFHSFDNLMLSFCNYHCFRCDADPAALAKYVFALVKKDKPVGELRTSMVEQLDVFLQSGMFMFLMHVYHNSKQSFYS